MTDPFDAELDDRLARLSAEVPFEPGDVADPVAGRTSPVGRTMWRSPIGVPIAPVVAIVILIVGIGLIGPGLRGAPGASTERGSASPSVVATKPASAIPSNDAAAFPGACAILGVTPGTCAGFAAWGAGQAGIEPGHIQRIELSKVTCPGGAACATESIGYLVNVHLVTDGGGASDQVVNCTRVAMSGGGINFLCDSMVNAGTGEVIEFPGVHSAISGGYHDVPCAGEAPENPCATPLPTIAPAALAESRRLEIGTLRISIDHAGQYSVVLGQASLPNGILTAASAKVTSSPADPLVSYDGYELVVTSLDGGPPFNNYYQHGWRPGTERVQVSLVFTVLMFTPGAVVEVTGVDVH